MKTLSWRFRLGTLLAVGLLIIPVGRGVVAAPAAREVIPGQYIVVFHDWVVNPLNEARVLEVQHGLGVHFVYEYALKGLAATVPGGRLALLRRDPRVAFISEDRVVSITTQSLPTGVDRIEGDLSSQKAGDGTGGVNVGVAIIDTGIQSTHLDLNVAGGYNCTTRDRKAWGDGHGHGTHVAGTVGAKDNGVGVVGVAPGAPLWAVKVLDNRGSGRWSWVICGIDWVTANASAKGIKVANMSLGGWGEDDGNCGLSNNDALHKAICTSVSAGVTYVVAAGNDGINFEGLPPFWPGFVPAAYNEVLTVTAVADFDGKPGGLGSPTCRPDEDDTFADFTNFTLVGSGDEGHTIAAPGVCILSTWKGGGYATLSGTSMASPHVAGTVALCIHSNNCAGLTPGQIIAKLRSDAAAKDATNTYGFADDPNDPASFINWFYYFGYLVYAGQY